MTTPYNTNNYPVKTGGKVRFDEGGAVHLGDVSRTPLFTPKTTDLIASADVFFKDEEANCIFHDYACDYA